MSQPLTKQKFQSIKAIVLSFLICFFAIACSSIANNTEDKITLRVGLDPTFPPFEMQEAGDLIVGFDIDLLQAIAEEGEIEISVNDDIPFNQLISTLENKQIHAIMSGMQITLKRAEKVTFSRPYFRSGLAIAIRDEDDSIKNISNLKNRKIAVQVGTQGARKAESISGAKVRKFSSITLALHELKNGKIDAVIHNIPEILHSIKTGNLDGLKVIEDLLTTEYYGIALPKNSPHIDRINDALEELIINRTYEGLYRRWFNSEPPPLPEIAPVLE